MQSDRKIACESAMVLDDHGDMVVVNKDTRRAVRFERTACGCFRAYDDGVVSENAAPKNLEPAVTPLEPKAVIARSREILRAYRVLDPPKLSVGDLSVVTKARKEQPRASMPRRTVLR